MTATYAPATWGKPLSECPRADREAILEATIQATIAELEDELNQGHTERFMQVLAFNARFRKYSIGNTILIAEQLPTASRVAGFKTWEKLGYHVKRGEKALLIRGPKLKKMIDQETGEIEHKLLGYVALPVFDASQLAEIDERPLPDFSQALPGDFRQQYDWICLCIFDSGISITEQPLPHGVHGMATKGAIVINPTISTSEKVQCALHELVHALSDHVERNELSRQQRELEAESGAWLLCKLIGMENPFSRDYLLAWKGNVTDLRASMTRIQEFVKRACEVLKIDLKGEVA